LKIGIVVFCNTRKMLSERLATRSTVLVAVGLPPTAQHAQRAVFHRLGIERPVDGSSLKRVDLIKAVIQNNKW
jgi:hypothetical protein